MPGFVTGIASGRLSAPRRTLFGFPACSMSSSSAKKSHRTRVCDSASTLPRALYVHLPFCRRRCGFCSFPIVVQKHGSGSSEEEAYLSTLLEEIYASKRAYSAYPREALKSIYFGGGTPSLTSPSGIERLLSSIDSAFGIESDAEITCEMDPGTFNAKKAYAYRKAGVNRASVGAQSFDDSHLETCGRIHRSADIYEGLSILRDTGYENISLDLMSGLPGQTLKTWEASLEAAIDLDPAHISAYDLELEEGTSFGNRFRAGVSPLPSEAHAADMMTMAHTRLTDAGWEHYEFGSFSRTASVQSQHNLNYWRGDQFFGFGLGATSLVCGPDCEAAQVSFRFERPRDMSAWKKYVGQLRSHAHPDSSMLYPNSPSRSRVDELQEFLMNGLRLFAGVEFARIEHFFGETVCRQLVSNFERSGLRESGLVCLDRNSDGQPRTLRVTVEGSKFESTLLSALLFSTDWKL